MNEDVKVTIDSLSSAKDNVIGEVKAVIFDLGNVLVDFDQMIAAKRISRYCDKTPDDRKELVDSIKELVGESFVFTGIGQLKKDLLASGVDIS